MEIFEKSAALTANNDLCNEQKNRKKSVAEKNHENPYLHDNNFDGKQEAKKSRGTQAQTKIEFDAAKCPFQSSFCIRKNIFGAKLLYFQLVATLTAGAATFKKK